MMRPAPPQESQGSKTVATTSAARVQDTGSTHVATRLLHKATRHFHEGVPHLQATLPAAFLHVRRLAEGIGGVQYAGRRPRTYFFDRITAADLQRLDATLGDSRHPTVWEALAILVGMRVWRDPSHTHSSISVRSDSSGALLATQKEHLQTDSRTSSCKRSRWRTQLGSRIQRSTHIPGLSNDLSDSLSRMFAPESHKLPETLRELPRTPIPAQTEQWWLTCQQNPVARPPWPRPARHSPRGRAASETRFCSQSAS